ncbi:MAG TPA: hypothetical protein VK846_02525 [Candidatus Limnocylindria bacterium]|nr:hypothetical protein [Candidatus Limnocylindria bacterium]
MKTRTSCLLLATLLLAGCWQKSLNPFYNAKDVVSEPKLAGMWKEHKENDTGTEGDRTLWTFWDSGEKRLSLVIENETEKHEYDAHVFRLDGHRFLDIVSRTRSVSTVPAHHLFKVVDVGSELKFAALNTDWVQKWLRKNPSALAHIRVADKDHPNDRDEDELVLTADTKALQSFVREHVNDEDFFMGQTVLKKQVEVVAESEKK